jgi:hypothetical protein
MSIFVIRIMACMTRPAFSGSLSAIMSMSGSGTICQETLNLSLSQPHSIGLPPPAAVKEIFYTLQGECANAGRPAVIWWSGL